MGVGEWDLPNRFKGDCFSEVLLSSLLLCPPLPNFISSLCPKADASQLHGHCRLFSDPWHKAFVFCYDSSYFSWIALWDSAVLPVVAYERSCHMYIKASPGVL